MSSRDDEIACRLEAAGGGGPLDVARLLAELARDGMTGREAVARARALLARHTGATADERVAWERVLLAVEAFDEPEVDDGEGRDAASEASAPAHDPEEPHEP